MSSIEENNFSTALETNSSSNDDLAIAISESPRLESGAQESQDRLCMIVQQINEIYQERLNDIDRQACGDFKLKYVTCKEWTNLLIGVIQNMVDGISELEINSKNSIERLERKLNSCGIADHGTNNVSDLKEDIKNLTLLIKRKNETGEWNLSGISFKTITPEQIFSTENSEMNYGNRSPRNTSQKIETDHQIDRLSSMNNCLKTELEKKCLIIDDLQTKLRQCCMKNADATDYNMNSRNCEDKEKQLYEALRQNQKLTEEIDELKAKLDRKEKVIESMKSLAFEVADKHDEIQQHKSQVATMEEELQQALKKIQFKDSVIKDLRRDLKSHLNKQLSSISSDTTPRSYNTLFASFSNTVLENEGLSQRTSSNNSEPDNKKFFEFQENRLIECQAEEDMSLRILALELDELFQLKQCIGNESEDEFIDFSERFKEKMFNIIREHLSTKNKLEYLRNEMVKISEDKYISKLDSKNACPGSDCGYNSQDEFEFDNNLLNSINDRIVKAESDVYDLKKENSLLREEIECQRIDLQTQVEVLTKCHSVLKELVIYFKKYGDIAFHLDPDNEMEDIPFDGNLFCDAMDSLIEEKDKRITLLNKINLEVENDLEERKAIIHQIEEELKDKDKLLEIYQKDVQLSEDTIRILEHEKILLSTQVAKLNELANSAEIKKLRNENEELQILNKNQIVTIKNLMEALETMKIGPQGQRTINRIPSNEDKPSNETVNTSNESNTSDDNQNKSGSLWGWW